jgi:hypothetical protein
VDVQNELDLGNGHKIEIGIATWDEDGTNRSIRNRYPTSSGGFSPHSSSEIPINDLADLIAFAAQHDVINVSSCAQIISHLSNSIIRQENSTGSVSTQKPRKCS